MRTMPGRYSGMVVLAAARRERVVGPSRGCRADGDSVRRDRGGGAVRGLADRDVARPEGVPGPGRGPGQVPERHRLHALHPPAGSRRARSVGVCSTRCAPAAARRSPPIRSTSVRSRSRVHRSRSTACPRRTALAAPCSTRSSSTPPRLPVPRCASSSSSRRSSPTTTGASPVSAGTMPAARPVNEEATVVVGADGRYSLVAKAVEPEQYHERPPLEGAYYTYWSNLPVEGFEVYPRPQHGWACASHQRRPDARGRRRRARVRSTTTTTTSSPPISRCSTPRRIRRAHPWRDARSALRRHRRSAELLPQAVRPRVGARR